MSGKTSQTTTSSTQQREQLQAQEIERLRAQLREQAQIARQEARAEMRVRYRAAIGVLTVTALLVGGVIGHFGFPQNEGGSGRAAQETAGTLDATARGTAENHNGTVQSSFATPWPVRVYVSGAVIEAQVVELPPGSLIADAIQAAGGAAPDADLDTLNLAAPVEDNQQVTVPRLGEGVTAGPVSFTEGTATQAIDINRASREELATLPYIGETKAAAIVAYRETNGDFAHIEEIQEVPGIGPTIFEHIAELITAEP